ncbi:MAG: limonene-1,2-epoxide hydrolase family protein [Acidimicrobiia bacterium]
MTPEETVDEFIRRVMALDLDGACELVSDDVEYDNVPIGKNHGPDAMKSFLSSMSDFDEVELVVHRQTSSGNVVMNERSDRFRNGDRWIVLPVAGVFEVDAAGKLVLWRDYFDLATFTAQMHPTVT